MFWLDFPNTGFKLGNFDFPYFILIALKAIWVSVAANVCVDILYVITKNDIDVYPVTKLQMWIFMYSM